MANILDYLAWRGDLSFTKDPFNEVDNLILCKLSYFDFGEVMEEGEVLTLAEGVRRFDEKFDLTTHRLGLFFTASFEKLMLAAAESPRFSEILISHPVSRRQNEPAMQFAAMTFHLPDGSVYVCYRGTDDYLMSWKESFLLSAKDEIPGQKEALAYARRIFEAENASIRLGGYSKGGNLALYTALHLDSEELKRVIAIYSNDGPGFRVDVRKQDDYLALKDRFQSLTPFVSVVGAMLEHGDDSDIVESDGKGVFQHDAFNWHVMGNRFVRLPERSPESLRIEATVKAWADSMTDKEKEKFLDAMFKLLTSSGAETISELNDDKLKSSYKFASSLITLDKRSRDMILRCLAVLIRERHNVLRDEKQLKKAEQENGNILDSIQDNEDSGEATKPTLKSKTLEKLKAFRFSRK